MTPGAVIGWYTGLPVWGRWLLAGVFVGALIIAVLWYVVTIPIRNAPILKTTAAFSEYVESECSRTIVDAERVKAEELEKEIDKNETFVVAAADVANDAATKREEEHSTIDAAVDGNAVDDVIYGKRADE